MIDQLEGLGVRRSPLLRRLWELRSDERVMAAFEEVMGCTFNLEGPDHGIDALDPNFVPIASVGNGDYYGLYAYPPARNAHEDPVVQYLHEVPSVEFECSTLASWLSQGIRRFRQEKRKASKDPASVLEEQLGLGESPVDSEQDAHSRSLLLPTESRIAQLEPGGLAGWILERCPARAEDLLRWEREWVLWWVANDANGVEQAALEDYGLEAYRALGWRYQEQALNSMALSDNTQTRDERLIEIWCNVHPPSETDLKSLVQRLTDGDARSSSILRHWCTTYSWEQAQQHPRLRPERKALGHAVVGAFATAVTHDVRTTLAESLLLLEYEEGLGSVKASADHDDLRMRLHRLRVAHRRDGQGIADANDWSDI